MTGSGNKYIRKYALFLTVLFSFSSVLVTAQTPEQTYAFAVQQSKLGNYDIAIKSFKRLQFFDEPNNFPSVFEALADCYFKTGRYDNAYYYYDLASVQVENDSLLAGVTARKVSCKLYAHQYQEALIDLLSFDKKISSFQQRQFDMLFGISYFYLEQYDQSKQYFAKSLDPLQQSQFEMLNAYFGRIHTIERRFNPGRAKVMSIILPGSGQIWAGDYRNGINSILLVSGLLYAGVALSGSVSILDSFIIVAPWFQRYYMGGYQNAYEITEERQLNEKNKVLAQVIRLLNHPSAH